MKPKHIVFIAFASLIFICALVALMPSQIGFHEPAVNPTPDAELGTGRIETTLGSAEEDYHFVQHGYYEDDSTVRVTGNLVSEQSFDASDQHQEPVEEYWFHPFAGQNPWGVYDDDSQDI